MHTITITFDRADVAAIDYFVDGQQLSPQIRGKQVTLSTASGPGLHLLRLKNQCNQEIAIKNVQIDGDSIYDFLYMSWLIDSDGTRVQPATAMWQADQTWYLPLGFPLSFWTTLVNKKIANYHLGKDLQQFYYLDWPTRHVLDDHYPSTIKDFFYHDFDFFCAPRSQGPHSVPWIAANISLDETLVQLAVQEIRHRRDQIWADRIPTCGKHTDGSVRDEGRDQWHVARRNQWYYSAQQWPAIFALLDSLEIQGISTATFGFLQPQGYIWPHLDNYADSTSHGLSDLYIPLQWPKGNLFKFAGSRTITQDRPILANTRNHVHALVNNSDQERVILSICMDKEKNAWLYGNHLDA